MSPGDHGIARQVRRPSTALQAAEERFRSGYGSWRTLQEKLPDPGHATAHPQSDVESGDKLVELFSPVIPTKIGAYQVFISL